jgi:Kef-type K+ transport system membrane component KefB/nucleotide-binding universal stress UspA family protein
VILQFGLLLVVARALGQLAVRFRLPSVVGELLAGFVLGPSLLGLLFPGVFATIFPQNEPQMHLIEVVSWLGVIMLLILTGLETDVGLIVRKGKGAAAISLGGIVVPFATGFGLGMVLPAEFLASPDRRLVFALFIGTAMSISAIPVIAKVLMEMNIIRRDIGQITLAAGMIDDTMGWILLSLVAGMASSGQVSPLTAGRALLSVLAIMVISFTIGRKVVSGSIRLLDNTIGGDQVKITALMAFALLWGAVTHALGLEAVLGAFIVGILVGQVRRFDDRLQHMFETVTLGVFAPVFFAFSGLRVNLAQLAQPRVFIVGMIVLAVAILGKFVGAFIGAKVSRLGNWEALALGSGMNARGAIEIIVATIGLSLGVLTPQMYSIILMVAIVTSIMAPPMLRWTLGHVELSEEEEERLEAEERRRDSFVGNIKRVLLPTRGGPNAKIAAGLVSLLVGQEEDVEVTRMHVRGEENGQEPDLDDEEVAERLDTIDEELDDGRLIDREVEEDIAETVLDEAKRGYDLLVMAATERRANGQGPLFAPFIDEIIQEAPCPLMIVSARADAAEAASDELCPRHILVPLSGGQGDRHAAEVAFSMARDREIVVDLLHVVVKSRHEVRVGRDEAIEHAVELGEDLVSEMAEVGHSMGASVHTSVVVGDNPANEIVARTKDGPAELVVTSSNRRPVTQRAFFGHGTDYVLCEAECPVVVLNVD